MKVVPTYTFSINLPEKLRWLHILEDYRDKLKNMINDLEKKIKSLSVGFLFTIAEYGLKFIVG